MEALRQLAMAQSRVMTETSRRMWDLSDLLINTKPERPVLRLPLRRTAR